jgi:isocitrate dehydrogenase (NAD+)
MSNIINNVNNENNGGEKRTELLKAASEKFMKLVNSQLDRVEKINAAGDFTDYAKLDKIIIGVCGGDGIGPMISEVSQSVLEYLLADEIKKGKAEFKVI